MSNWLNIARHWPTDRQSSSVFAERPIFTFPSSPFTRRLSRYRFVVRFSRSLVLPLFVSSSDHRALFTLTADTENLSASLVLPPLNLLSFSRTPQTLVKDQQETTVINTLLRKFYSNLPTPKGKVAV